MTDKPRPVPAPAAHEAQRPYEPESPSAVVFVLLALFLGNLGVHRFYIGDSKRGLTMLLMTFPGIILIVPALVAWVMSIVDLCMTRQILARHARGEFD